MTALPHRRRVDEESDEPISETLIKIRNDTTVDIAHALQHSGNAGALLTRAFRWTTPLRQCGRRLKASSRSASAYLYEITPAPCGGNFCASNTLIMSSDARPTRCSTAGDLGAEGHQERSVGTAPRWRIGRCDRTKFAAALRSGELLSKEPARVLKMKQHAFYADFGANVRTGGDATPAARGDDQPIFTNDAGPS